MSAMLSTIGRSDCLSLSCSRNLCEPKKNMNTFVDKNATVRRVPEVDVDHVVDAGEDLLHHVPGHVQVLVHALHEDLKRFTSGELPDSILKNLKNAHLLYDLEDLAVVALGGDELVDVLLPLDLGRPQPAQGLGVLERLLPALRVVVLPNATRHLANIKNKK